LRKSREREYLNAVLQTVVVNLLASWQTPKVTPFKWGKMYFGSQFWSVGLLLLCL
jgi:hypothetical protein